jgi:hypothetical protein
LEIFFKKENSWNKNMNPFKRWPFKPNSPRISSRKRNKKKKIGRELNKEEISWRQKSRIQWLKEGEKTTKFFHRSMIHRRFINCITKLEND